MKVTKDGFVKMKVRLQGEVSPLPDGTYSCMVTSVRVKDGQPRLMIKMGMMQNLKKKLGGKKSNKMDPFQNWPTIPMGKKGRKK